MEVADQIKTWHEFFEAHLYDKLVENVRKGAPVIAVDFALLAQFSLELADDLLEHPDDALKAAELALARFDLGVELPAIRARLHNLPESQRTKIKDVRSKHLNKLIQIQGIVRQKTDVRPQVTSARFECPSCGNIINVLQLDSKFKEPTRCGCGRKGKFLLLSKELVDAQKLVLEEAPEDLEGGEQPKRLDIFLKNDLVSPLTERRTNPGSKVVVVGAIKEVPIPSREGGILTRYDLLLEANFVDSVFEEFSEISLSPGDLEAIRALSHDPRSYEKIVQSMAPSIFGLDKIKEALLLQLMGGVKKVRDDGQQTRGDIHILLIGDPGAGKSQLLKRIAIIAPKSRFVSGKGASGAGLTAAVVRDEFLRGWALEAGALVLANRGLACIDELDKMSTEDRSAMHEALEQQCYEYETLITLANGEEVKIGEYVEELLSRHASRVVRGKDCLILQDDIVRDEVLTTDWRRIFPTRITRVSKHLAPKELCKLTFTNGRTITVTPEHPLFIITDGQITTKRTDAAVVGDRVPVPRTLPIYGTCQSFHTPPSDIFNARSVKHILVPVHNDADLYRLVGYLISEGSTERNRGKCIGVNFTNKDPVLLGDMRRCMRAVFGVDCHSQERIDDHAPRTMLRYISRELAEFFRRELPEVLEHAPAKAIPAALMKGKNGDIAQLLLALFEGDGHVAVKVRTLRIGYGTNSRRLAEQIQDLLLRFGIRSSITAFKDTYKVNVTGYENIARFSCHIGFLNPQRQQKINAYLSTKSPNRTYKDVVPACGRAIIGLLERQGIRRVGRNTLGTMRHDYVVLGKGIARTQLQKLVASLDSARMSPDDRRLAAFLGDLAHGDIAFERVKAVARVPSTHAWTYDITIEPHHTFISQGLVLHNTVTISKANIQATLRAETTVLAAANPKFGRFDPYEPPAKQLDLPATLLSRFDLIFPIRDLPDPGRDERLASFILKLHQSAETGGAPIETGMLKKYIAYAKQFVTPHISDEALEEIKEYFVRMRSQEFEEGTAIRAVSISARQLEGLVRMAEASARTRLAPVVTRDDAKRAVELLHFCLSSIGMDPQSGKIDIDRITTGISATQRGNIAVVRQLLHQLEETAGKAIPLDDLLKEAASRGIPEADVEEALTKLKQKGDIFEPRSGYISRIQ